MIYDMATQKINDVTITYKDDQATKEAVFKKVVDWFMDQETFSGESLMQSDAPQLEAPVLLSDLADDILQFKVVWDE